MARQRGRRGGVSVTDRDGILRLRWTYAGRRWQLSLQVPDTEDNRRTAEQKAMEIEQDITSGRFDDSLKRYRLIAQLEPVGSQPSTVTLFDWFTEERIENGTRGQTISTKYKAMRSNIQRFGREVLSPDDAKALLKLLRKRQSPLIANQNLLLLKGFGKWLKSNRYRHLNPFENIKPVKGSSKRVQDRTPFTRDELARFLKAWRSHPTASHYYAFTVVLFSLGLRPSEAIGLRWRDVDLEHKRVTIAESLARSADGRTSGSARQRKETKNGVVRILPLNKPLIELFTQRKQPDAQPDDLIFKTPTGKPIDDHNYRTRYWKPMCEAASIPYRPPYTTRHTLISYGIEFERWTLVQAAAIAGHKDTRMVAETYGHLIDVPTLPDIEGSLNESQ